MIKNGTVVAFQDGAHRILPDGVVVFDGRDIICVGDRYEGDVDQVIDAAGRLVIPGLINHHMAFGIHMQLFRLDRSRPNFFNSSLGLGVQPAEAYQSGGPTAADWRASARHAMASALRTGTTTFAMVPNFGGHPFRGRFGDDGELVEMVRDSGLRAYLALPFMSGSARGTAEGAVEWIERPEHGWEGLEQAVEFASAHRGGGEDLIDTFLFPYQADNCTPELLRAAKQAAGDLDCTLKIHVAQYLLEFHKVIHRHAKTPIQYLADCDFLGPEVSLAHAIFTPRHPWLGYEHGADADTEIILESGASVAHCPVVFARSGVALHSFSHYVRSGIPVSLGTDTSPHDMFMEMRTAALMSKLVDEDPASGTAGEVFDAATLGGATALGRNDIGRLAPGSKADIVIVKLDTLHAGPVAADDPIKALVYCARSADVETVIVDGVTRVDGGQVAGIDVEQMQQESARFNARLRESAGRATHAGRPVQEFYGGSLSDWLDEV